MKKLLLVVVVFAWSCKTSVEPLEENELITTVKMNFENGGVVKTFSFKDPDGDGGASPTIDKIVLDKSKTYNLSLEFFDESKSPVLNITDEILDAADEHLVAFTLTPNTLGKYTYSDKDKNGFNIGLKGTFETLATAGSGKLKVQLRHQPPINGMISKNGTIIPGSDDVNIDFDIEIK